MSWQACYEKSWRESNGQTTSESLSDPTRSHTLLRNTTTERELGDCTRCSSRT